MPKYTIPGKDFTICDMCLDPRSQRRAGARIEIKRDILDGQGTPVTSGNQDLQLCDSCMEGFSKTLYDLSMKLQPKVEKDGSRYCATYADFTNLGEDEAGFGDTQEKAREDLVINMLQTLQKPNPIKL